MRETETRIAQFTSFVSRFLAVKNRKYGDSALRPLRIFSRDGSVGQIQVRIDDKLSRINNATGGAGIRDALDLIGYLVLLFIAKGWDKTVMEEGVLDQEDLAMLLEDKTRLQGINAWVVKMPGEEEAGPQ